MFQSVKECTKDNFAWPIRVVAGAAAGGVAVVVNSYMYMTTPTVRLYIYMCLLPSRPLARGFGLRLRLRGSFGVPLLALLTTVPERVRP